MTRFLAGALASAVLLVPSLALAQNPMMASVKAQHDQVKGYILKTADLVPENLYSFKATPEVRSIAQLLGHIADATNSICGNAGGGKAAPLGAEKSMTTKAQLTKALADAFAVCDKVIAGMTDAQAMETTKFFIGGQSTRGMIIAFNTAHNFEHYGNLVTYMRLNKIVPPSTAGSN
ncbi:MAG TPA: DinB family protein [Vicinamibacterales bacterium]|nr:DinB family protein [Vicinamibacterales bacterium]